MALRSVRYAVILDASQNITGECPDALTAHSANSRLSKVPHWHGSVVRITVSLKSGHRLESCWENSKLFSLSIPVTVPNNYVVFFAISPCSHCKDLAVEISQGIQNTGNNKILEGWPVIAMNHKGIEGTRQNEIHNFICYVNLHFIFKLFFWKIKTFFYIFTLWYRFIFAKVNFLVI